MTAYKAPSRELGEKLNVPELWNDWKLNYHSTIQNYLLYESTEKAYPLQLEIWEQFLAQEPNFAYLDQWWAIMGAVSQYNFDDIYYFCDTPYWMRENYEETENFQRKFGVANKGWVMSPKTYDMLKQKLEIVA